MEKPKREAQEQDVFVQLVIYVSIMTLVISLLITSLLLGIRLRNSNLTSQTVITLALILLGDFCSLLCLRMMLRWQFWGCFGFTLCFVPSFLLLGLLIKALSEGQILLFLHGIVAFFMWTLRRKVFRA